jgi:hypothetical protein
MEWNLEDVRKAMIKEYCGGKILGEAVDIYNQNVKIRKMLIHKDRSNTIGDSIGYLFFSLAGSPPKAWAVFLLGNMSNGDTASGSLIINGKKRINDITLVDLGGYQDNDVVGGSSK